MDFTKVMVDVELLRRLRAQMLIHSYLYYTLFCPVWDDDRWQDQANRLEKLQKDYLNSGLSIDIGFYDDAFRDFTGSTGMHLPKDEYVREKSLKIYREHSLRTVDFNTQAGS